MSLRAGAEDGALPAIDYERAADAYAAHRGAHVLGELARGAALSPHARVLEIGCGTGSHVAALARTFGCRGWGLDPSAGMLAHAAAPGRGSGDARVTFCRGGAETLPFAPAAFDLVLSVDVVHHLRDPAACFGEARRVLKAGGMLCTVTDSEEMIRRRRPLTRYWPSTAGVDLRRYPGIAALEEAMIAAGFTDLDRREIAASFEVRDAAAYRERTFSCLRLIDAGELVEGLARLEADLRAGPVEGESEFVCLWGRAGAAAPAR